MVTVMPANATDLQRELILRLFAEHDGDEEAICAAYAKAEAEGIVFRKWGDYRLPPREFAKALIRHGRNSGWLRREG